jgi:ribosomal protein S18 acetylase RimI-like enzyme
MKTIPVSIQFMARRHLDQVLQIEKKNGSRSSPVSGVWSKKDFLEVLRDPRNEGLVVVQKQPLEKVIGFAIYSIYEDRYHIPNMAVDPAFCRKKVGTHIILKMKAKLRPNRTAIDIDVRETNLNGQLFLKKMGFKAIQVDRDWYEKPREDAYKFRYQLENVDVDLDE